MGINKKQKNQQKILCSEVGKRATVIKCVKKQINFLSIKIFLK